MYAIYGNMDPINIPPLCYYIYHTWILWDTYNTASTLIKWWLFKSPIGSSADETANLRESFATAPVADSQRSDAESSPQRTQGCWSMDNTPHEQCLKYQMVYERKKEYATYFLVIFRVSELTNRELPFSTSQYDRWNHTIKKGTALKITWSISHPHFDLKKSL